MLAAIGAPAFAMAQSVAPQIPIGTLEVNRGFLRTGTSPTLTWAATYPQPAEEAVIIDESHTATTTKKVKVNVRVAGSSLQSGNVSLPTKLDMKVGGGSWSQRFLGVASDVSLTPVYSASLPANTSVDFRFQGASSQAKNNPQSEKAADWNWAHGAVSTGTSSVGIIALVDGDAVPASILANTKSFLMSYLAADAKTIDIGPRDVIYLSELQSTDANSSNFDLQDLVIVVTFDDVSK